MLAILAIVFVCGTAVGSAVTRTYLHRVMGNASSVRAVEVARHVGVERLRTELNLTPAQEKALMQVLDDYGKYYQNIEDDRDDVAAHSKQLILNLLTTDQQKRFNEMLVQARQ
ncbi:MAG: hypothetical protein JO033_23030 [Acidobacteriaceae bacterium]|nr:hypothetical protein [Acidobacteriaceae bacterium]MBV9502905.1 hypothetical protein [Acidobacteriaceae bacterium]